MARLFIVLFAASAALAGAGPELGLSGRVLTVDGKPVSGGTVYLQARGPGVVVAHIEETGAFRIVPHTADVHDLYVSAPGFVVYRAKVSVPASKTFVLPTIRLSPNPYLKLRLLSPAGEPLTNAYVMRRSFDVNGTPVREPPGRQQSGESEEDGVTLVGPLPQGITTMVVDLPPFARTRLPDVRVTRQSSPPDGGLVRLTAGATLHVDVVDEGGAVVPDHPVMIEDAIPLSPASIPPIRTDAKGRATFQRLAAGGYRLRTVTLEPCGDRVIAIRRSVEVPGAGTVRLRLVIGGSLTLKLSSNGVPLRAARVSVSVEAAPSSPPAWLRERPAAGGFPIRWFALLDVVPCIGATNSDGRVAMSPIPPGPARVTVRLPNATWERRIVVPPRGREVRLDVPGGFMALRAVRADTGAPVSGAPITWTSAGTRVEATTSATGDVLLDGVAPASGVLTIDAAGFSPFEQPLAAPPDVLHEVSLQPTRDGRLQAHVVAERGQPVRGAVLELRPGNPLEVDYIATTNDEGAATFFDVPPGPLVLTARAEGHAESTVRVAPEDSGPVTVTLRAARK